MSVMAFLRSRGLYSVEEKYQGSVDEAEVVVSNQYVSRLS